MQISDSKETLCGSHFWVNYSAPLNGEPLVNRLYRFTGAKDTAYGTLYTFKPMRNNGPNMALSAEVLTAMLSTFKPFVLDCSLTEPPFNPYRSHRSN